MSETEQVKRIIEMAKESASRNLQGFLKEIKNNPEVIRDWITEMLHETWMIMLMGETDEDVIFNEIPKVREQIFDGLREAFKTELAG